MKILLATGIYPPDIGGPATYTRQIAEELSGKGHEVTVVTYGEKNAKGQGPRAKEDGSGEPWNIIRVGKSGGPLLRWRRYAGALKKWGKDADIVYAFSSVSCGVPLKMAALKKPKKILRLGGDFLWERYTDLGGSKDLRRFYAKRPMWKRFMQPILRTFDHIVFSTGFQQELYRLAYKKLPGHSVIENALLRPSSLVGLGDGSGGQAFPLHQKHDPLRLLFMGRFVRFKNLPALLQAIAALPHAQLTLVGSGPVQGKAAQLARKLGLRGRVTFLPSVHGGEKEKIFAENDLLVLPSLTEISPHVAVEARAAGLPVLLTEDNGLSEQLRAGMIVRRLRTSKDITRAVLEVDHGYELFAKAASVPFVGRGWPEVVSEHLTLFETLLHSEKRVAVSG